MPTSANDPALVCILSRVSMLSLSSTGMPCNGPSTMPRLRSASALRAMTSASGLSSMMALTPGPFWSNARMRVMYSCVRCSEVSMPEAISAWSWATVASLCCVGTAFCAALCAAAEVGSKSAARRRLRITGAVILFPPESLGLVIATKSGAAGRLIEAVKIISRPRAVNRNSICRAPPSFAVIFSTSALEFAAHLAVVPE